MDKEAVQNALEEVKRDHNKYEGEPIKKISIGIGRISDGFCIFELETQYIIHKNLTLKEAELLFEKINEIIR